MSKINTLRFKVPTVAQRQLDRGSTSVEKPNSNNKLLFSLILTFLCLLNTSAFSQCITIPVSPVTISGEPYISTFSNINLNGTGTAAATALPGSSVSISFHQDMNFSGQYCPGCVTFHQVGVGGTQTPISCADNGQSLDVNTTFTAPNTPGVYYITMFNTLDIQCNTVNYSNSPSSTIAVLVVTPPSPTTISGQPYISTFTNVKLNGGSNGAFVNAGSSVSISFHQDMNFSGQYCPGCVTYHQVGVGGTQTPISCAHNGQSLNVNTTFTAPNRPGVYYITMFNTLTTQCKTINYFNSPSSAIAVIVVKDGIPPIITCPANISVSTDLGVCGAKVTFSSATATDSCSATVTQTTSYTSGQTFPVGTSTITYSAKDPSNNTASCSFNVLVIDNEAPKVTCPANISVSTDLGVCGAKVNFIVSATDNCSFTAGLTGLASGSIFPVGTTTNLFKATDASNNVSSCRFTVTVKDNEVPKITCPTNISVNTDLGVCGAKVTFISATATDNCSATVTQTTSYTSGQTFPVGTSTITYSAKDPSNNTVSCSFSVVVKDKEAPKITCPASVSKSSDVGICGAKYTFSTPIATDNCSAIVTQTGGLTSGSTFPVGINTVTFTAKDPSGNTTSCSFTVTVNSLASFNPNVCYNILNNGLPIVLQGDNAQLYSAKQTQVQSFKFIALPNGNIQILSSSDKNAKKSLSDEAPKGDLKAKLKDYKSEDLQSDWQINCVNGLYVITHKASGLVLTVGTTANDGKIPVVVAASNGSSNQSWTFQAVPCPAPDNGLQSKNISNLTGYAEQQRNVIDLTTNQGLTTDFYTVEKINKVSGNFEVLEHRANTEVTDKVKFITFYDNAPYEGDNVYRIKTTFLDGSEAYSNLQQINTKVTSEFSVFPNPTDEEAWIDLKSYSGKEVKLELTDLAGKTLQLEVINEATAAPHRLDLSSYTTGLYFIKVQTKGRQVLTKKLQVTK